MAREIFISYSRKDLDKVKMIKEEIEQATGAECWMDLEGIESGNPNFVKAIVNGIVEAKVFLFMLSNASQSSEYALGEVDLARNENKEIIFVNIDNCVLTREFRLVYGRSNMIDWNISPQHEKLLRDLKKLLRIKEETTSIVIEDKHEAEEEARRKAEEEEQRQTTERTKHKIKKKTKSVTRPKLSKLPNQISSQDTIITDPGVQNHLGDDYYYGDNGRKQNYSEAVKWYNKAAWQGHPQAQFNLGHCYESGKGVPQDNEEAVKWYRKAAEKGLADAQDSLGFCYDNGKGVPQDYFEAVKWFRKAAEQGHDGAQCDLGLCYEEGRGVAQDYTEAVKWYRKAAEQGHNGAQLFLALCYEEGRGVSRNYMKAKEWCNKAAKQGNEDAIQWLEDMKKMGY